MRTLGIDYGEKRIGLAISDALGMTAQGIETLQHGGREEVLGELLKICRRHEVNEIVIGLPLNMDGSMGPKAREIMDFVPAIEKKTEVPVKTWDERLSSKEAGRLMVRQGLSRRKQKINSDRLAATLILQGYLELKRSGGLSL